IVEDLRSGKRQPAYNHEKVISLADISMYTENGDVPLADVLEKVSAYTEGKPVDLKGFSSDEALRDYFGEILPDYDRNRVYTTDIRKLFSWYNQLIAAGVTKFKAEEIAQDQAAEAAEKADQENTADKAE
ncbi:MAG: hypothetical protein K2F79_03695, partial [Muribaculaceae bacterium]|nr:hypothetical protein [Muribaculaceae bacterium]